MDLENLLRHNLNINSSANRYLASDNSVKFKAYLKVKVEDYNHIIYPYIYANTIQKFLCNIDNLEPFTITIDLSYVQNCNTFKTAPTLLKYLIRNSSYSNRLQHILLKDKSYYGNQGILLDEDFNIIYMLVKEGNLVNIDEDKTLLYVNSEVLLPGATDLVYKLIAKKVLPYYCTINLVDKSISSIVINDLSDWTVKVNTISETAENMITNHNFIKILKDNMDSLRNGMVTF